MVENVKPLEGEILEERVSFLSNSVAIHTTNVNHIMVDIGVHWMPILVENGVIATRIPVQ